MADERTQSSGRETRSTGRPQRKSAAPELLKERWWYQALTPAEAESTSFDDKAKWAADAQEVVPEGSVLWKQYEVLVGLYRYYLDMAWKVSVWYLTTTGVVLAYFFSHVGDENAKSLPLLLIFLGLASSGLAYLTWRGGRHLFGMIDLFEAIAERLKLPGRPHVEFACFFLLINTVMFLVISGGAFWLFFDKPWIVGD